MDIIYSLVDLMTELHMDGSIQLDQPGVQVHLMGLSFAGLRTKVELTIPVSGLQNIQNPEILLYSKSPPSLLVTLVLLVWR